LLQRTSTRPPALPGRIARRACSRPCCRARSSRWARGCSSQQRAG